MDSIQLNHNVDSTEGTCMEQFFSPDSSDDYSVFGDPELLPRVGDQYQVEIPPVITKSDYLLYRKNPFEGDSVPGLQCAFLVGLPIPVTWISTEVKKPKHEMPEFLGSVNGTSNNNGLLKSEGKAQIFSDDEDSKVKVEFGDVARENTIGSGESANFVLKQEIESTMHQKQKDEGYQLVPGYSYGLWSDIEESSFLLGLYIFGKNLVLVKKFVESKTMGEMQSFYYGKFYRSDEHRRWSDCRKMRSRKCVYGQRLFTSWRQQELLTRFSDYVSEECQNTLLEVSKTFVVGKMSLEEYVFTLKSLVGMNILVQAVGIGSGKRDLTGVSMEPSKSNHVAPMRQDIPSGKACSSLTTEEIIKYLTGDFRLSKARSNDLFWEAVWPRLLARGWHSEQPSSKNSLVFLISGVKKFSRRRLVKGVHYFDSITDVLNKVALERSLLELDNEVEEENTETKLEKNSLADRQRHLYLQPRTPNRSTNLMKFTVVDTSMADGKSFKVRELRTLPDEVSVKPTSGSYSEESVEDSSELSSEDSNCNDETLLFHQEDTNNSNSTKEVILMGASNQGTNGPYSHNSSFKISKKPTKYLKRSRRLKQDGLGNLGPVTKRHQKLSSCTQTETSHQVPKFSMGPSLEHEKPICGTETSVSSENLYGMASERVSSPSLPKESPIESSEGISGNTHLGEGGPPDKTQHPALIDLNLPQASPELETGEASIAAKPSKDTSSSEQQPNVTSRRQSTRNRPPTARALEALANGFLTSGGRKRKSEKAYKRSSSMPKQPRNTPTGTEVADNFASGSVAPRMIEVGNGVCNTDSEVFKKFQFLADGDAAQVT
ncbi:hypothetical protein NMG60_11025123 [Bertholletia excelsa]